LVHANSYFHGTSADLVDRGPPRGVRFIFLRP